MLKFINKAAAVYTAVTENSIYAFLKVVLIISVMVFNASTDASAYLEEQYSVESQCGFLQDWTDMQNNEKKAKTEECISFENIMSYTYSD